MHLRERVIALFNIFCALVLFSAIAVGQSTIVSDDFRAGTLNTSLWTFVNPAVPSSISFTGVGTQDARLNFNVPAGSSHDVWNGGNFAPRIMQNCNNTDFEIEIKFESPMTSVYQIQGVIVQQDALKFLRFDFVRGPSGTRVFAASFTDGSPTTRYDQVITPASVLYLRAKRVGNQWTSFYSYNGTTWNSAASFAFTLVVSSVGPFAGNAGGSPPAFTSLVDYFFNTASPISPEDIVAAPTPPSIITQPMAQTVLEGESATFNVTADGSLPLFYQWQKTGLSVSGATNSSYSISSAAFTDSGATFRCIVSNAVGTVTSNAATLHVNRTMPSIMQQPSPQNVLVGQTVTFGVVASGSPPLTFQWQKNGAPISGATASAYTTPPTIRADSGATFRCIVGNALGSVTSNAALLSVTIAPPSIVSDDFSSTTLNTSLWTFVNPRSDASVSLTGTGTADALLTISVPAGTSHDVWSGGNFAPRLMQTIPNGDFEAEVKFQSAMTAGYQIQGIIVQQDSANFIRFDFTRDFSNLRVFAATFTSGVPSIRFDQNIASSTVLYLRVKRIGNQWTQLYSYNGTTWTNAASFVHALTVSRVGPFAGNAGATPPAFTSTIDYVFNTAFPIVPEDPVGPPPPPTIVTQPNSIVVSDAQPATFTIVASGQGALSYQWQRDSVNILGATNAAHTIATTQLSDSGRTFRCIVSNSGGSLTSNSAMLSVIRVPPSIVAQPSNQTVVVGDSAAFTLTATGSAPVSYQWQRDSVNIPAATNSRYTIPITTLSDSGARFRCIVSNAVGTVTSASALLQVASGVPAISVQPQNQTITEGQSAVFSVVAVGVPPLVFQWQKNGVTISGATNASYTTPPTIVADSGSTFRCIVMNAFGTVTSNAALLIVNPLPSGAIVSDEFNAASLNGALWQFINPAAPSTLTMIGTGTQNALLSIAVPAGSSHDVWSSGNFAPRIMQTISDLDFEVEVKFQSLPSQAYQLQGIIVQQDSVNFLRFDFFHDGGNFRVFAASFASGSPTVRYNVSIAQNNPLWMRVKRQGNLWTQTFSFNGTAWTNAASFTQALTVRATGPFVGNAGNSAPAFTGLIDYFFNTASPLLPEDGDRIPPFISNTSVTPTANSASILWTTNEKATSIVAYGLTTAYELGSVTDTTRVISHALQLNGLTAGTTYHYKITSRDSTGNTRSTADSTFVTTSVGVSITQQPVNRLVAVGQSAMFSVRAIGTPPLVFQWQRNDTTIVGATDSIYTTPLLSLSDSGATYRCIVSNAVRADTSDPALLRVAAPPLITTEPLHQSVLEGDSATFAVVATGSNPLSYQWRKNNATIAGATNPSFTTSALARADSGTAYRCIVTNIVGADTSVVATVSVNVPAAFTLQPTDKSVAVGQTARFVVRARGTAPITYQWQRNDTSIVGATDSAYTTPLTLMADSGTTFRCIVANLFRADTSLRAILHVATPPTIVAQPMSDTVVVGDSTSFAVVATGTMPLLYEWQRSGVRIVGATSATLVIASATFAENGFVYRCIVSSPFGADTSETATLTVRSSPTITIEPSSVIVAPNQTASFHVAAIGTRPFLYEWLKNDTTIIGANDSVYTTPQVTLADSGSIYRCIVRNDFGADTSMAAILRVASIPTITSEPMDHIVSEGDSATFSIVVEGVAPLTFRWFRNGALDTTATSGTYTLRNLTLAENGDSIYCIVSNVVGSDTSRTARVTVNAPATIILEPTNASVVVGATATFRINARGSAPITFQWLKNTTALVGATDSSYMTPAVSLPDSGAIFRCIATNPFGVDTSAAAILRVFAPPVIATEPLNQTVTLGSPAFFFVNANGSEPLSYQWSRNGLPIPGATAKLYTIGSTARSDSGVIFRCIVSNPVAADTSDAARLSVNPLGSAIVSDDFSNPTLNTALWRFINPRTPSTLSLVGTGTSDARVSIALEPGTSHDVWLGNNNTPRLMQPAPNTDFEVEVKFESPLTRDFQIQGIIVEQDSLNFMRFDVYHDGNSPRAFAATFVNGNPTTRYNQGISSFATLYLRVRRVGNAWTQSYSFNGTTWTTAAQFSHSLVVRSVGPFFGNTGYPESSTPDFTGVLDYFFNTSARITPEDSIRVPTPPTILAQPEDRTVIAGSRAAFVLSASGSQPLTYQWQKNNVPIPGATNASYEILSTSLADSGSTFRCIAGNAFGVVTSTAALLRVQSTFIGTMTFVNRIVDENSPRHSACKTVGDIDRDGYQDILAASGMAFNDGLYWYKYPTWSKYKIATGSFSTDMQAADLDADGDLDVVIPKGTDLGVSVWWYENPLPTRDPAKGMWTEHFLGNTLAHDVEVADINRDSKPDIVVRYDGVTLFLSTTVPATWQQVTLGGRWSEGLAIADLDTDGDLDIAMNGAWSRNPLPLGNPTVPSQWTYFLFDDSWEHHAPVHAADLSGDGKTDLVIGAGEHTTIKRLWWYEQPSAVSGNWNMHVIDTTVHDMHAIKTADMNNDGFLDIITAEMHLSDDPDEIVVFLGNANGTWTKTRVDVGGGHNLRVFDLGNDGDVDIMSSNTGEAVDGSPIELWENLLVQQVLPLSNWERHVIDSTRGWQSLFITSADMDNDRKLDIVTGGWWYKNPGALNSPWTKATIGAPLNNMVLTYDFDDDGDADVLGTQGQGAQSNATFSWAKNAGNGTFTILSNIQSGAGDFVQGAAVRRFGIDTPYEVALAWNNQTIGVQMLTLPSDPSFSTWARRTISTTSQGEALTAKDIDRDRNVDLLLGTKWLKNNGTAYSPFTLFPPGTLEPDRNRLADINHDDRLDAIVSFESPNAAGKLVWYEQPASAIGVWTEHIISTSVIGPMSLDVADMDRDGDYDVIVGEHFPANPDSARLIVFENMDFYGTAWTPHVVHKGDEHLDGAQTVDIDGDGDLDIISVSWAKPLVVLYENKAIGAGAVARSQSPARTHEAQNESLPKEFALYNNFPNPFNPSTTIRYDVPREAHVEIQLFNILGQEVVTLVNGVMKAGRYTAQFDASHIASGVYFYRMQSDGFAQTRKLLVTK